MKSGLIDSENENIWFSKTLIIFHSGRFLSPVFLATMLLIMAIR